MADIESSKKAAGGSGVNMEKSMTYSCGTGRMLLLKNVTLVLMVLMTLLFVLLITYPSQGLIVLVCIWFSAIPLVFAWIATLRTMRIGQALSETEYKKGPLRIQQDSILVMLFSVAALIGVGEKLFQGDFTSLTTVVGMLVRVIGQIAISLGLALMSKYHCAQIKKS